MVYDEFDDAGTLEFHHDGSNLDMLTLGILQEELHEIIERVVIGTLQRQRALPRQALPYLEGYDDRRRYYSIWEDRYYDDPLPLVRANCERVELGSWYQEVALALSPILLHPDVRAVLQGVAGNVVHAILVSGVRGVTLVRSGLLSQVAPEPEPQMDPFNISLNMMEIGKSLIKHSNGRSTTLTITAKHGGAESQVKFEIEGRDDDRPRRRARSG